MPADAAEHADHGSASLLDTIAVASEQNWVQVVVAAVLVVVVFVGLRLALGTLFQRAPALARYRRVAIRLLDWIVVPVGALVVVQQAGIGTGNLWAMLSTILALVAIGFVAVWSVLSNISATVLIASTRLFRIGDDVEILEPGGKDPGVRGRVDDLNLLFTTLRQEAEEGGEILVRVPSNIFFQKAVRIRRGTAAVAAAPPAEPATDQDA